MMKKLFVAVMMLGLMTPVSMLAASPAAPAPAPERHPHIRQAIKELREAKHELETADHDFGGHKKEAIEAVDHAIEQLEQAAQYDKH